MLHWFMGPRFSPPSFADCMYAYKFCIYHSLNLFQALLESMGANASTGPEAVATAEKNAAILTAKAGARDPSAIPSICRISAALQYPAGKFPIRGLEAWVRMWDGRPICLLEVERHCLLNTKRILRKREIFLFCLCMSFVCVFWFTLLSLEVNLGENYLVYIKSFCLSRENTIQMHSCLCIIYLCYS